MTSRPKARKGRLLFLTLAALLLMAAGGFVDSVRGQEKTLPRLVDLGATQCIPCKMMAPILDELAKEYAGKLEVVFIDVWQNRDLAAEYGVRMIPTQIFFAPSGEELFRHTGFYAKNDILNKWRELGYPFAAK
ncbi:MAG: thioredoxin fold domain-containing protein [Desulfuromonadaceae bacterium]|nr:thioredoxin fold domain-containing protein [Desulfuromonadaceae bacterium]